MWSSRIPCLHEYQRRSSESFHGPACHQAAHDRLKLGERDRDTGIAAKPCFLSTRATLFESRPLQDPGLAVAELRRCVRQLGFVGVEIGTRVGHRELGDICFDPFFDIAAELGALVLVHPADTTLDSRLAMLGVAFGAGLPGETGVAAAGLLTSGALLRRRPGARLCLAHAGGTLPWLLPRLDKGELIKNPDTPPGRLPSALTRSLYSDSLTYDVEDLLLAVHRYGAGHVMLGTDYPFAARESQAGAVISAARRGFPPAVRGRRQHERARPSRDRVAG